MTGAASCVPLACYRSWRDPNPFQRAQPPARLKLFLDASLSAGDTDGQGDYRQLPLSAGGALGFPDAAAVLRSYLGHPALDVARLSDDLDGEGALVICRDDEGPVDDGLSFEIQTATGISYRGILGYRYAIELSQQFAHRYRVSGQEALAGTEFYRIGNENESDLAVTERQWLLDERDRTHDKQLANVVSPEEALAVIGLYLRWHRLPVILGAIRVNWHPTAMYRSAAFTFRDNVFALSATMEDHEPEEMLCELDSLLFSLVGAYDAAAGITDLLLNFQSKRVGGWQYTGSKEWQTKLEAPAKALYEFTKPGTEMQHNFQVLRWLRNSVHNQAHNLFRPARSPAKFR